MILIVTHKQDYTADFLINKLNERQLAYRRFNCEDFLAQPFSFGFDNDDIKYLLQDVTRFRSVWFRRTKLPEFSELSLAERIYIQGETESFLKGMFTIIGGKWLSDPFAVYKSEYKMYQLKVAREIGFNIPKTLITNSKKSLNAFYQSNTSGTVIKPMNQTRFDTADSAQFIYTSHLYETELLSVEDADLTPCIYQEYIEKEYELRITVVAGQIFCAAIDSQKMLESQTDWRRKPMQFRIALIPEDVAELCCKLLKKLGLEFGAIDMIKTKDGRYIFLEINPNGQWAWIEAETGLPIAEAIINFLTKENDDQGTME